MAETDKKKDKSPKGLPKKTHWHLYSLQRIETHKLSEVINKVLRREYVLIK